MAKIPRASRTKKIQTLVLFFVFFCQGISLSVRAQDSLEPTPVNSCTNALITLPNPMAIVMKRGIHDLLMSRCRHYAGLVSRLHLQCRAHAQALVDQISLPSRKDERTGEVTGAFFGEELIEIFAQPKAQAFLGAIDETISQRQPGVNIWKLALAANDGHFEAAWQWMALLFQDASDAMTHLHFLRASLGENHKEEVDRLERILRYMASAHFENPIVQLFPEEIGALRDPSLYHFYMIGYLALKTEAAYTLAGQPANAALLKVNPFIVNTVYEFFSNRLIPGITWFPRNIKEVNIREILDTLAQWVRPTDPVSIDAVKHKGTLEDIYLGYAGVEFALSRGRFSSTVQDFVNRFASKPRTFIENTYFRR